MLTASQNTLSKHAFDYIDDSYLDKLVRKDKADADAIDNILAKSMSKEPLTVEETADLLAATDPESVEKVLNAARELKNTVYGNRIVLFGPLYIGNHCVNDCSYCGFRRSNDDSVRMTLSPDELKAQVEALEKKGHKRLILVYGEHPTYSPEFIADSVRQVYNVKTGNTGEIRRVNINAAPMTHEGYKTVKDSGIGTYQIFQETYHHPTYALCHPENTLKSNYLYRLDGLDRAMEAGLDDVGIGALFGLYDWRFETLGLVSHAVHLMEKFGVGPHTISFPRLRPAQGIKLDERYQVSDDDFMRMIAILRLAVPYTGLILTAREEPEFRRKAIEFGISQIDAGSRIDIGAYTDNDSQQKIEKEQFMLGDTRPLEEVIRELLTNGYLPSFCTACYRLGRTGEHFMEFAIPGFIKRFCTPNAITTLVEYLEDYASEETKQAGMVQIAREVEAIDDENLREKIKQTIISVTEKGERDIRF